MSNSIENAADEAALRRVAVVLAGQLPEGRDNCVSVCRYMLEVVGFIYGVKEGEVIQADPNSSLANDH